MGEHINIPRDAATIDGYLASPPGTDKKPSVVVVQEWWGLVPHIEGLCDRFAKEGFLALAPDLYRGKKAKTAEEAGALMNALDWSRALGDLHAAVRYVRALPRATGKVGVVGFCMGGALTFATAARVPDIDAAVPFYGVPGPDHFDPTRVRAPVLAHFSSRDQWATPDAARGIQNAIRAQGGQMELHLYDAEHAFMRDSDPKVYSPENAALAWKRTLEFLHNHLG